MSCSSFDLLQVTSTAPLLDSFGYCPGLLQQGRIQDFGMGVLNCATELKFDHTHLNPAHSFHLKCAFFLITLFMIYSVCKTIVRK